MTIAKKQKEIEEKLKIISTWESKLNECGRSRRSFCNRHGLCMQTMYMAQAGNAEPRWETVRKIEAAFKKEGV